MFVQLQVIMQGSASLLELIYSTQILLVHAKHVTLTALQAAYVQKTANYDQMTGVTPVLNLLLGTVLNAFTV